MSKIKAVFFDVDDTLYNSTLQVNSARENALKAMREAGLEVDEAKAKEKLDGIVQKYGSNYERHFDELLKSLEYSPSPRIVAAGIIAYHATKTAYLIPYPETVPTLISLRDLGYKLGVITDGVPVKQWEKLIMLGLQHFFHKVFILEGGVVSKTEPEVFVKAAEEVGVRPSESMMVGDRVDKDVSGANKAGFTTVQVLRGKHAHRKPANEFEEPDYVVSTLKDVLAILGR